MGRILFLYGILAGAMIAATTPTVTVTATPSTLNFTFQSGATKLPKAQTVSVKAGSTKTTFTTTIPPTDFWLSVNIDSGTLPASLSVSVNPNSMPVNVYQSSITITATGIAAPAVIAVNLTVTPPPSTLSINPGTISVTAPPSPSNPVAVILTTDVSSIEYTATSGAKWMTVFPSIGIVNPGGQSTFNVFVDASALVPSAAPYTGKITVVASGAAVTAKSQTITVNVTVNSQTPTISSIWPPALPLNGGNQMITIRGTNFYSSTLAGVQGQTSITTLTTTVISPTTIMAVVPSTMLVTAGNLDIVVQNPAPGGASTVVQEPVLSAPTIMGIFNAASYASATVSPGELITLFGTNIGPSTPATMDITGAGYINTTLSNLTVTMDGYSAPILYAGPNQVTVQVPYEDTVGNSGVLVLTNGNNPAANASVTLGQTSPGIFTADGSGTGQAAAINTAASTGDVTLNGTTNPARIGDIVSFYLTGEGDYNPSLLAGTTTTNTGFVIPVTYTPLPQISPLPTVQIGGVDASAGVSYAGVVPGSIIGVLQINVAVPAGSSTGASVPVAISINGNSTQPGVTINVHP